MRAKNRPLSRSAGPARPLPLPLWLAITAADGHKCIWCGATVNLQVDHMMPRAAGGRDDPHNLFTLCEHDNMIKSNYWVADDGYVFYRPWDGYDNIRLAAKILRREQRLSRSRPRNRRLRLALKEARL